MKKKNEYATIGAVCGFAAVGLTFGVTDIPGQIINGLFGWLTDFLQLIYAVTLGSVLDGVRRLTDFMFNLVILPVQWIILVPAILVTGIVETLGNLAGIDPGIELGDLMGPFGFDFNSIGEYSESFDEPGAQEGPTDLFQVISGIALIGTGVGLSNVVGGDTPIIGGLSRGVGSIVTLSGFTIIAWTTVADREVINGFTGGDLIGVVSLLILFLLMIGLFRQYREEQDSGVLS